MGAGRSQGVPNHLDLNCKSNCCTSYFSLRNEEDREDPTAEVLRKDEPLHHSEPICQDTMLSSASTPPGSPKHVKKKPGPKKASSKRRPSQSENKRKIMTVRREEKIQLLPNGPGESVELPELVQPEIPDLGWPKEERCKKEDESTEGWLMKRNARSGFFAQATVGTIARGLFWTWRYFEIREEHLAYWEGEAARTADTAGSVPRGTFNLKEIDGVAVRGKEVTVQFTTRQSTGLRKRPRAFLRLRCASSLEAERWGAGIRSAAAASIRQKVPHEWDVHAMLAIDATPHVRLVAEVPLPAGWVVAMQRLLDYTYVFKRTKDRHNRELPVRLEVRDVVGIQNFAAWMKYTSAREGLSYRLTTLKVDNAEHACIQPQVHTATHSDPIVKAALGETEAEANEQWLFHGTSLAGVNGIASKDFKIDLAGSHRGTMYGKGLYLAECSTKADEYAEEDEEGYCRMILCRVSLGRILVDSAPSPNAPELQVAMQTGFDSLCGDRWAAVGTYREFVLFNQGLVYPAYIITYKRITQIQLLSSVGNAASQNDEETFARLIPEAARLAERHLDPVVRYRVCMLLSAHCVRVAPILVDCLRDARPVVRQTAAYMLGQLGANSSSTVMVGKDRCEDLTKTVAANAVPALTVALRDENVKVRRAAASAITHFGVHAASAVRVLVDILNSDSEQRPVREASANALGHLLGKLRHEAVDMPALAGILARNLEDQHMGIRRAVATTLGQIGNVASVAVPQLAACLKDPAEEVRTASALAIGSLRGGNLSMTVAPLVVCLRDTSSDVQKAAAFALGHIGEEGASGASSTDAASAVTALSATFRDLNNSPAVRKACVCSLGKFGVHAEPAVANMVKFMKDTTLDSEIRIAAAEALGQLGKVAAPAVPCLRAMLRETSDAIRKAAISALGHMGPAGALALSGIIERIKDSNAEVRKAASVALGQLGIHGAPAVPALELLRDDAMLEVRDLANAARKQILVQLAAVDMEAAEELMEAGEDSYHFRNRRRSRQDSDGSNDRSTEAMSMDSEDNDPEDESEPAIQLKVGDKIGLRSDIVVYLRKEGDTRAAVNKFPHKMAGLQVVVQVLSCAERRVEVRGVSQSLRVYSGWIDISEVADHSLLR